MSGEARSTSGSLPAGVVRRQLPTALNSWKAVVRNCVATSLAQEWLACPGCKVWPGCANRPAGAGGGAGTGTAAAAAAEASAGTRVGAGATVSITPTQQPVASRWFAGYGQKAQRAVGRRGSVCSRPRPGAPADSTRDELKGDERRRGKGTVESARGLTYRLMLAAFRQQCRPSTSSQSRPCFTDQDLKGLSAPSHPFIRSRLRPRCGCLPLLIALAARAGWAAPAAPNHEPSKFTGASTCTWGRVQEGSVQ